MAADAVLDVAGGRGVGHVEVHPLGGGDRAEDHQGGLEVVSEAHVGFVHEELEDDEVEGGVGVDEGLDLRFGEDVFGHAEAEHGVQFEEVGEDVLVGGSE